MSQSFIEDRAYIVFSGHSLLLCIVLLFMIGFRNTYLLP